MSARGLFITVEGGEGVGKSTNVSLLRDFLQSNGVDVVVTREPGGTQLGEQVRQLLLDAGQTAVSDTAELLLMFAARAQHLQEVISPALAAGQWVLCDRFTDATYAYQGGGRGMSVETIRILEDLVQGELRPDYTLLLDVPVELGMSRARGRGELDRIEREDMEFFERVRTAYLELAGSSSGRFRVIDASRDLDEVQEELLQVADQLLKCWGVRRSDSDSDV